MLRQMVFKNFIHFKDFQSLSFKNGPHFFIGANSTGKTSTLEILRRCMSTDINTSISSSYNKTENAYAFCKFDVPSFTKITNFQNISSIYSGVVKTINGKFIKIICLEHRDKETKLIHIIYHNIETNDKLSAIDQRTINTETSKKMIEILTSLLLTQTHTEQTNFEEKFINYVVKSREELPSITDEEVERCWTADYGITVEVFRTNLSKLLFIKDLESTYVATMAMRSIGPLQWTRSNKIMKKDENYLEACGRAEILIELMASVDVCKEKAKRIFNFLTHPFQYVFTPMSEDGLISVREKNSSFEFPLLKTPEGIIEAKQFSLIMAHKVFHTICLEEPDRCMHPQMVERMRDTFQSESENKVVIIISHNPFLINSITAKNTHVFFRKGQQTPSQVPCGILSIEDISRQMTDVDNLKKLLFATKVLCVEGKTDKILIEGLFDFISKKSNYKPDEKHDMISHQLIVLGSKTSDYPVRQFCKQTSLHCKLLFDRDYYVQLDHGRRKNILVKINLHGDAEEDYSNFFNKTVEAFLVGSAGFDKFSKELSKKGIFIWKSGNLEDTIVDVLSELTTREQRDIFDESLPELTKQTIKKKLSNISRNKLEILVKEIYKSKEGTRFLDFLKL